MTINETKKEIIVSKAEYKKAMKVGTEEFRALLEAKRICPNAKVVVKKSKNKENYKNLTKKFMLDYIQSKDNNSLETFTKLFKSIGTTYFDDNESEYKKITFFYVRNEFLNTYPQFMTESDRIKYENKKKSEETEENTNIVEMSMAG